MIKAINNLFFPKKAPIEMISLDTTADKTAEVAPKFMSASEKAKRLAVGILNSRVFHLLLIGGIAAALIFAGPLGWALAGVAGALYIKAALISAVGLGILIYAKYAWHIISLELLAFIRSRECPKLGRLLGSKQLADAKYHEICHAKVDEKGSHIRVESDSPRIILGVFPDALGDKNNPERLVNQEKVGAVLSLTQKDENCPRGAFVPYTSEDWNRAGVNHKHLVVQDYTLLTHKQLDESADWIAEQIAAGRSVYVHCRSGMGRSPQPIAAYMIKYLKMTPKEAADLIKSKREISETHKKLQDPKRQNDRSISGYSFEKGLLGYEAYLNYIRA
jgi:Dual specificity phosphatase, catalytic domain